MKEYKDKVVLVTGAGKGAGRAIAWAFSKRGAILALNDLTPINLDETLDLIHASGGVGKEYVFDVARRMPAAAMVQEIIDDWGHIDILINSAQVKPVSPVLEMDEWDWRRTVDVNLTASFFTIQSAGKLMCTQGSGSIINTIESNKSGDNSDGLAAYTASMMGIIGLTQEAARELSPYGVRVNAVCAGPPVSYPVSSLAKHQEAFQRWLEIDTAEVNEPVSDTTRLVLFLCSDAALAITGQVLST